jgi:short-subunit dehydrogenase
MLQRGRVAVINMSSTAGHQALPFNAGYSAAKAHQLVLSEAVHAEANTAASRSRPCARDRSRAASRSPATMATSPEKLPKFTIVSAQRVARDALRAADRGKISVIPSGVHVKLAFGPSRELPCCRSASG